MIGYQVSLGDKLTLIQPSYNLLTIHQFLQLLYAKKKDQKIVKLAINNTSLPEAKRERLKKFLA